MAEQKEHSTTPQLSPPASEPGVKTQTADEAKHELREAISGSNEVLASATTVLTLFPDTMTVDRAKLNVIHRTFFQAGEVVSMRIEDVLNVTATIGPFLGTVKITSRVLSSEDPFTIGKFWREDAMRLKHITQGYVIALQRDIDCSSLGTQELAAMLERLGQDEHPS